MDTCGIKMEESYKIPEFCVKAEMCQAALALDKERAVFDKSRERDALAD